MHEIYSLRINPSKIFPPKQSLMYTFETYYLSEMIQKINIRSTIGLTLPTNG